MRFREIGRLGRSQAPQGLANRPVCLGQAKLDAALEERGTQVGQQLGAGEIHVRDVPHEEDQQPRRGGPDVQQRRQLIADVIDGGMSQSLVNETAGARTPLSGLVAALITLGMPAMTSARSHPRS